MGEAVSIPPAPALEAMQRLYDDGLIVQAYQLGVEHAPVQQWRGLAALILGGRIMGNLGAQRLGRLLHLRAYRQNPDDVEAGYYGARAVFERRGPLAGIAMYRRLFDRERARPAIAADWLCFRATLAAEYRDFETADDLLTEANQLAPDRPWFEVEHAHVLEKQDRYEEALSAARRSLQLKPWFRAGVQYVAHLLQILDRDDEALALMKEAAGRIESAALLMQLASLQDHLHLHTDALATLQKLDACVPVVEKPFAQYLAYVRSNIAYHGNDIPAAIDFAEKAKTPFMTKVAEQLRKHDGQQGSKRVQLPLPFIRQHHMTCGPATLAAISRYWNRPADHLAVVDAICYDGTSNYSQRKWARGEGWYTREFAVTWDSAVALIDRGVPFTLATTFVTSGHLQAVIGYDTLRGTLLCRDPYQYYINELSIELLLKKNAARGPRGMVMLPPDQVHRLDGLDLPDAELFDHFEAMEKALEVHDRPAAQAARQRIIDAAPNNRLVHQSRLTLAAYDGEPAGTLEAVDGLLSLYPKDKPTLLIKTSALRQLDRRDLLLPLLKEITANAKCDAIFLKLLADELRHEIGAKPLALNLLRKSLRRTPTYSQSLIGMANLLWGDRRREEATELYFMAACVDEKNEQAADSYFIASRHLRQTDQALSMLRRRFERFGKSSGGPAYTLFMALERLNRVPEALQVLDQACALRPDDGQLLLDSADAYGRRNEFAKVDELLQQARGKVGHSSWLRYSARLSMYRSRRAEALDLWRQVLAIDPAAYDAHEHVAQLLAETDSPAAAQQHLLQMHERFPHNIRLAQLRITWLRSQGAAAVATAARELLELRPSDVWARVELALALVSLGQNATAVEQAELALQADPQSPSVYNVRGRALQLLGRVEEARADFRKALSLSVDFTPPMHNLVDSYTTPGGQREALDYVRSELVRQVIFGESLLAYRNLAAQVLDPIELLNWLTEARTIRPDLWQTHSVLSTQLCALNRLDEALTVCREAVDQFPLLPRGWSELAYVQGLAGDRDGQIESLRHCMQLSPGWSHAARQLATALVHRGDKPQAAEVLEQAIARDPLEAENYAARARLLWNDGQRERALELARRAVQLAPVSVEGWNDLVSWSQTLGRHDECVQFARQQCEQRSGEAASWLVLARVMRGAEARAERLAACDRAIAISPLYEDAYDLRAILLHEADRKDEALAACSPEPFGEKPPLVLLGRRAWLIAKGGDLDKAINEMGEVLRSNTTYYWGWEQLMQWMQKVREPKAYATSAEMMTTFFPHDLVANNYHADALLACGESKKAIDALKRSVQISPADQWALKSLVQTQLEVGQPDNAEATLQHIRSHAPMPFFHTMQLHVAVERQDKKRALSAFENLLGATPASWQLNESIQQLEKLTNKAKVTGLLTRAVQKQPSVPDVLVEKWAARAAGHNLFGKLEHYLKRTDVPPPLWSNVAVQYLNRLAAVKNQNRLMPFVRRHRTQLRSDTLLWGTVGYAMMSRGKARQAVQWLNDYETREGAKPWMLLNRASALRRLNRFADAERTSRFAMQQPADHATVKHRCWLAFDDLCAGRTNEPLDTLRADVAKTKSPTMTYVCSINQALDELRKPDAVADAKTVREVRRQLSAAVRRMGKTWAVTPEARHALRHAAARVVQVRPTFGVKLWASLWRLRTSIPIPTS